MTGTIRLGKGALARRDLKKAGDEIVDSTSGDMQSMYAESVSPNLGINYVSGG
jgi:hypothetical protein